MKRKIYLASSWRNRDYPMVLDAVRGAGHEVYDFRNPAPGNKGFGWNQIEPDHAKLWDTTDMGRQSCAAAMGRFVDTVTTHPVALAGYKLDKDALDWSDTCVLALPCGRSAHLELGYAAGQGKETFILLHGDRFEPELMYLLCTTMATSVPELISKLGRG